MIRLGLRLTLGGGREAAVRLVVTAAAVALGVALLFLALAGINATDAQNSRYAWLNTGLTSTAADTAENAAAKDAGAQNAAWWLIRADTFDGREIARVDVAATGPDAPVPPGIPRLPGPGEYYASPALAELIRDTPADQLAARFPGTPVGTIGSAALPASDSLIAVVGQRTEQVAAVPGARLV
ncbi:MAG: ABC transporter permease, partial [Streptomycetaceae bacterium]|nr:ABC transporter permease [Streptomycetaceae bacterium]